MVSMQIVSAFCSPPLYSFHFRPLFFEMSPYYYFQVVAAVNSCQTLAAPFDLQLDFAKNCACPSCVLMCSAWVTSWADR